MLSPSPSGSLPHAVPQREQYSCVLLHCSGKVPAGEGGRNRAKNKGSIYTPMHSFLYKHYVLKTTVLVSENAKAIKI